MGIPKQKDNWGYVNKRIKGYWLMIRTIFKERFIYYNKLYSWYGHDNTGKQGTLGKTAKNENACQGKLWRYNLGFIGG